MTAAPSGQPAFRAALHAIGEAAADRCWHHWQLVQAWQRHTNLTGVRSDADALATLYRDALVALPHWHDGALIDVGSGAGFPGLVLAIARPERPVTLVEPRRKRASFLRHAAAQLGLRHVVVSEVAIEHLAASSQCAAITMRAVFAEDSKLAGLAAFLCLHGRVLVFRRGPVPPEDRSGRLQRVATHAYALARAGGAHATPLGHAKRLDEWVLTG